jgi:hypothetical protein
LLTFRRPGNFAFEGKVVATSIRETFVFQLVLTTALLVADEKKVDPKLEPFQGVWETTQERKIGGELRQVRVVMEFKGDSFTFFTESKGAKQGPWTGTMTKPETNEDGIQKLTIDLQTYNYPMYYRFVNDRLVLIFEPNKRPFAALTLSGEYVRQKKK